MKQNELEENRESCQNKKNSSKQETHRSLWRLDDVEASTAGHSNKAKRCLSEGTV